MQIDLVGGKPQQPRAARVRRRPATSPVEVGHSTQRVQSRHSNTPSLMATVQGARRSEQIEAEGLPAVGGGDEANYLVNGWSRGRSGQCQQAWVSLGN
jgi:hypothetical protein